MKDREFLSKTASISMSLPYGILAFTQLIIGRVNCSRAANYVKGACGRVTIKTSALSNSSLLRAGKKSFSSSRIGPRSNFRRIPQIQYRAPVVQPEAGS
jgi:hypothetical protein